MGVKLFLFHKNGVNPNSMANLSILVFSNDPNSNGLTTKWSKEFPLLS